MRGIKSNLSGFTAMELLVSITILGLVLTLALPRFEVLWSAHIRRSALQELQFDIRRMRAETLSAGVRGVMAINSDGRGYVFGFDDLPYSDPPAVERAVFSRNFPAQIVVSVDQELLFDSKGIVIDSLGTISNVNLQLEHQGSIYGGLTVYSTGAIDLN